MKQKDFKQLFTGLFYGLLGRNEQQELIHSTEESKKMLWKQWEAYGDMQEQAPPPRKEKMWNAVQQRLAKEQATAKQVYLNRTRGGWRAWAAVIAVLIAFSAANLVYWHYQQEHTVAQVHQRTGKNQRLSLNLPDGTKVTLNSTSKIVYPKKFTKDSREVKLKGEAFFRVTDNRKRPFLVHTDDFDVEVTGTAFTVTNYENKASARTVLIEGNVKVKKHRKEQETKVIALEPNASVTYLKKHDKFTKNKVNADRLTSWRNGMLIFDNAPLVQVADQLENWYGVQIHIDEALKGKNRYTMRINKESLRETMRLLRMTTAMQYRKENNHLYFIAVEN